MLPVWLGTRSKWHLTCEIPTRWREKNNNNNKIRTGMVGHRVKTWGFPPIPEHAKSIRGPGFWIVGLVRP